MNIKITTEEFFNKEIFSMGSIKPGEICVIEDKDSRYNGDIVMRTFASEKFEVMNLSKIGERWEDLKKDTGLLVTPAPRGFKIIIEVI